MTEAVMQDLAQAHCRAQDEFYANHAVVEQLMYRIKKYKHNSTFVEFAAATAIELLHIHKDNVKSMDNVERAYRKDVQESQWIKPLNRK